jgi:hypothetical protein
MKTESKESLVTNHSDPELANHRDSKDLDNEFDEIVETVLTSVEKKV